MIKWLKIFLIILVFAAISVATYFVLKFCGITDVETLKSIIQQSGGYAVVVYVVITTLLLTFLCFVPLLNSGLIVLAIVLFEIKLAFVAILVATLLSNSLLFLIGKFGKKLTYKIIKKEEIMHIQNMVSNKAKIVLPIMFVLPGVPDESLCLIAGMTNMKYWYLMLVSAVYHSIEIGLFCFVGSGIVDWAALSLIEWVVLINVIIIDIGYLFKLEKKITKNQK